LPPALTFQDERYCVTAHFAVCQLSMELTSMPACDSSSQYTRWFKYDRDKL
jgi:hypothetical protein